VTNGLYNVFDGKSIWKKLSEFWTKLINSLSVSKVETNINEYLEPSSNILEPSIITPSYSGYNLFSSLSINDKSSSYYNLSL